MATIANDALIKYASKFKTVGEVDAEIADFKNKNSKYLFRPLNQDYLAALENRKQQLSEQSSGFKPYVPPIGAGAGRGVVNDDRGNPPIPKKKNNTKPNKSNSGPHPAPGPAPAVATPTTQAGEVGTLAAKFGKPKPGKRLENPLGNFSSYTYQISLYMITPDAYNAFMQSDRTNIYAINNISAAGEQTITETNRQIAASNAARKSFIDTRFVQGVGERGRSTSSTSPPAASSTYSNTVNKGGAYLIAQSGGINSTTEQRAPGFTNDFYIDDLKFKEAISNSEARGPNSVEEIEFKITEPYGFSFLSRLRRAQVELQSRSSSTKYKDLMNATRNHFVLGIKFLGYDENGDLIDPNRQSSTLGNPIGNAYGIYQRFFDILITSVKYKLDGKSVVYSIEAKNTSTATALGLKRGIIEHNASVDGATVREALMSGAGFGGNGLISKLNKDQKALKDMGAIEIAAEWDVKFQGDAEKIASASLISPADLDKRFWPQSNVQNAKESNVKKADKNPPNNTIRKVNFTAGTPIIQAINEIVKQSSFLEKALSAVTKSETEPSNTKVNDNEINNPSPTVIEWFNIRPEVMNLGWDDKQKDFIYKTTYYIQTYSTPYTLSAYAGLTEPYYGPDKRYNYWFTGKNSEVLKLDVSLDNLFYNITFQGDPNYAVTAGSAADIPTIAGKPQNQPKQGYLNSGAEAQNSYMTSLYDVGSWATSKLTILGDPDFLMTGVTNNTDVLSDKFYGPDGYTINPRGRQVFIEVNFNEPEDYDNESGLLSMNNSIYFFDYPKIIKQDLESRGGGVILQVLKVTSTFSKGKFEQQLDCWFPFFTEKTADVKAEKDAERPPAKGAEKTGGNSGPHPRNANSANEQAAARIKRQGAPKNTIDINAQAAARIKRQGGSTPTAGQITDAKAASANLPSNMLRSDGTTFNPYVQNNPPGSIFSSKPKQDQTTTIRTKNGKVVQDDNAGNNINPRSRH
jgi:hypothetical protein